MQSILRPRAVQFLLSVVLTFMLAGCGGDSNVGSIPPFSGSTSVSSNSATTGSIAVTTTVPASKSVPADTKSVRITLTQNGLLVIATGLTNPSTFPVKTGTQTNTITNVPAGAYTVLHESLDANGNVTGVNAQSTSVSASATAQVAVTNEQTVTSLAISPSSPTVAVGANQAMTATATLADSSQVIVTVLGTWTSSSSAVATVSNTAGSQGTVTGVASGTSTIGFTYQGVSANATVTVSGTAPTPSPSPNTSPSPSPTTVNNTTSNSNAWKLWNNGITLISSAHKPGANQTGTYAYVGANGSIVTSDDAQSTFTYRSSGTTAPLNKVIWVGAVANIPATNQNNFIAVGGSTTILISPDGVTWTAQSLTANNALNTALGTNTILTSICTVSNGALGSGFLICGARKNSTPGQNGTILFTTDIKDATRYVDLSFGQDVDYTDCAFGNIGGANQNLFEVVSPIGANGSAVRQSVNDNAAPTNGWSANTSAARPMAFVAYCKAGVAGANACFIAAGTNAATVYGITVTAGGQGWANNVTSGTGGFDGAYQLSNATTLNATGIAFATFGAGPTDTAVILGNGPAGPAAVTTGTFPSPSGANWVTTGISFKFDATNPFTGPTALVGGVSVDATAPNPFTVNSVNGGVLSAANGLAYTVKHYSPNLNANGATAGAIGGAPFYVAVGDNDFIRTNPTVLTSADGQSWTQRLVTNLTTQNLNAVIQAGPANGLRFVAVGNSALATSTDGVTWTGSSTALTQTYRAVTFGNGKFVAVGDAGWVQTSTDGLTWTAATQTGNGNPNMKGIAFGAGTFVAVADAGVVLKSTDGVTWTPAASSPLTGTPNMRGIVFATNTFIAVGAAGTVARSTDGSTFTKTGISVNQLNGVAFVSTPNGSGTTSTVIAVGAFGDIRVSSDLGQTWNGASSGGTSNLLAAFATSSATSSLNTTTNVTTNTYTQIFGTAGGNTTVLLSR